MADKPAAKDFHQQKQAQVYQSTNPNYKHIVRILNVDLPGEKQIRFALTGIKGIGLNFSDVVCRLAKVDRKARTGDLPEEMVKRLNQILENPAGNGIPAWMFNRRKDYETGEDKHLFTGTLAFVHDNDLKRLKKIKSLRGLRHQKGLPVRGQRTRSHFRRNKGKVVGVSKKKVAAPAAEGKESGKKEPKKEAKK